MENKILHRVQEKTNIIRTVKWRKARCTFHVSSKNCLLKHVIIRKSETTIRRGRRRRQLLDNFKERNRHWNSKGEVLDRSLWRSRFGRGFGPCRKTHKGMDLRNLYDFPKTQIISLYGIRPFSCYGDATCSYPSRK